MAIQVLVCNQRVGQVMWLVVGLVLHIATCNSQGLQLADLIRKAFLGDRFLPSAGTGKNCALPTLKTLTSLNKEVRPFFLGDSSIWSFPSLSSLSDYSIWRS